MKQFSIRDLLFLVVIIALTLGWWLDRRPAPVRYRLGVSGNHAFVLDTATGQVWQTTVDGGSGGTMGETPGFKEPKTQSK